MNSTENYDNWIQQHYSDIKSTMGRCHEACMAMQTAFPELRVTNGYITLLLLEDLNFCSYRNKVISMSNVMLSIKRSKKEVISESSEYKNFLK